MVTFPNNEDASLQRQVHVEAQDGTAEESEEIASPQRQVHVETQDGSTKEKEEIEVIEVIRDNKTCAFKIKEEAEEEPRRVPSTSATGQPAKEGRVTTKAASADQAGTQGTGKKKIRKSRSTRNKQSYRRLEGAAWATCEEGTTKRKGEDRFMFPKQTKR